MDLVLYAINEKPCLTVDQTSAVDRMRHRPFDRVYIDCGSECSPV
jgi:hypothetical protein